MYHTVTKEARFELSHIFSHILFNQMGDLIDVKNISFKIRKINNSNGNSQAQQWVDRIYIYYNIESGSFLPFFSFK